MLYSSCTYFIIDITVYSWFLVVFFFFFPQMDIYQYNTIIKRICCISRVFCILWFMQWLSIYLWVPALMENLEKSWKFHWWIHFFFLLLKNRIVSWKLLYSESLGRQPHVKVRWCCSKSPRPPEGAAGFIISVD